MKFWIIAGTGCLMLLIGCSTPEYQSAQSQCTAQWYQAIPPNIQQRVVTEWVDEEIFSGISVCEPAKDGKQICEHKKKTIKVAQKTIKDVDLNEPARNAQINACTIKACELKYGNGECKVPK